jgi:hypothetical protein
MIDAVKNCQSFSKRVKSVQKASNLVLRKVTKVLNSQNRVKSAGIFYTLK